MSDLIVIGGGLAGSEAAFQAAERGLEVALYEMRPAMKTGAHQSHDLAELVCSNSLGSSLPDRASGVLMTEMRSLGSLLLRIAEENHVPAGGALAVDREGFSQAVTAVLESHPNIKIIREELKVIPEGLVIVASGPLTSPDLAEALRAWTGSDHLYFYDALSPIVEVDSLNFDIVYRASRYDRGSTGAGDYLNCPLNREEYEAFVSELKTAERIPLRDFEQDIEAGVQSGYHTYFEGCLPIEVIAERGMQSLAFGPMRPVGLDDPRTGRRPHAVVQLRQDNIAGDLYNLVGFQTNLRYPEQRRVLRMIPGMEEAVFARYGQMHRNTFINAPTILTTTLQHRERPDLFFAGQIMGVEGYLGNMATGLLAGINAARLYQGESMVALPRETMLGALCHYVTNAEVESFQPMKANFGLMPLLEDKVRRNRRERAAAYASRSAKIMANVLQTSPAIAHSH